jgi:uncharacterized PurR-regulated membrane protein YhhQ (DUF165 family)
MSNKTKEILLITAYLGVIILANNLVAKFGIVTLWITAFFIIPFDLFTRDLLHEKWHGNKINLMMGMLTLISLGSLLSFLINQNTKMIALGSFLGFMASGLINLVVYELLWDKKHFIKMNVSNFFAVLADSILFLWIAFEFDITNITIQTLVKFLGGMFWVTLYVKYWRNFFTWK